MRPPPIPIIAFLLCEGDTGILDTVGIQDTSIQSIKRECLAIRAKDG